VLSLEDHTLLECDSHPCSVLGALTAHETTSVQPPADLQPEKRSLNLDGCRGLCQGANDDRNVFTLGGTPYMGCIGMCGPKGYGQKLGIDFGLK